MKQSTFDAFGTFVLSNVALAKTCGALHIRDVGNLKDGIASSLHDLAI